jgi:pilus assembly protein CpaB
VVTLLVTPEDGERIALAAAEGQIMLALRNPLDTAPTTTAGIRTAGLLGQAAPPAPKPKVKSGPAKPPQPEVAAVAPKPAPYTVEAIRGAKRTEEIVR